MRPPSTQKFAIVSDILHVVLPKKRTIQRIYLHCTAGSGGDAEEIDRIHRVERHWRGIGYNFLINSGKNGFPAGIIQVGRPIDQVPANVRGDNTHSIGVSMVGNWDKESYLGPDLDRRIRSAFALIAHLAVKLHVKPANILLHRMAASGPGVPNPGKSCPGNNFPDSFRPQIIALMNDSLLRGKEFVEYNYFVVDLRSTNSGYKFI